MKLPDQISVESTEMIFNDHDTNISLAKKKKKSMILRKFLQAKPDP